MKKLIGIVTVLGLITGVSAFASDAVEVDHLIKCEDGSDIESAVVDLNSSFVRGEIYASAGRNTETGYETYMVVVKKPFKVSAPTLLIREGRVPRVCVTVSKE